MKCLSLFFMIFVSMLSLLAQDDDYLLHTFKDFKEQVNAVDFSADGKYLAVGSDDKCLMIYDLATLEPAYEHKENYFKITALEFTGQNNLFVSAGKDIKLINLNNESLKVYPGKATEIYSLDYAPERSKLTAGSFDRRVRVWDVASTEVVLSLEGHEKSTLAAVFSPDEKYIVTGSQDKNIKVWNALTGEELKNLEMHNDNIYSLDFHPNGKYFASASRDMTIRLWNIETGEVVKTYPGHQKAIMDIEFTPDGEHLASASLDGTVIIWEVKTGKKLYSYIDHEGAVMCLSISADGKYLATGGQDFTARLWDLNPRIFADAMYYDEIEAKITESYLFKPKKKGESKKDYLERQAKAQKLLDEIVAEYYERYKIEIKKISIE